MSIPNPIVLLDARARYVHPAFQMMRASTKTVFDSTGKLVTVPANAIGWDHDPATGRARGYLAEPSATNLLLHSNDLTQWAWNKFQSSITPSAITGPDGSGMAKLVEDTASSTHSVYQSFTINDGATVVYQLIAKAGERQSVRVQIRDGVTPSTNLAGIDVSLTDGTISNASERGTCELIDYDAALISGGFCFIWIAATIGSGNTSARVQVQLIDGNGDTTYTGDGTSGLYVGYCQAEEGYPTSYIETGGATATRAGDGLFLSNFERHSWWKSSQGTILVSAAGMPYGGSIRRYFDINGDLGVRLSGQLLNIAVVGTTLDTLYTFAGPSAGSRHAIALSWGGGEAAISINGGSAATMLMIGDPAASGSLGIGNASSFNSNNLNGVIERVIYYPQRISNADLQSLTAIQE